MRKLKNDLDRENDPIAGKFLLLVNRLHRVSDKLKELDMRLDSSMERIRRPEEKMEKKEKKGEEEFDKPQLKDRAKCGNVNPPDEQIIEMMKEWNKQRQATDKILAAFQDKERDADFYRSVMVPALLDKNDAYGIKSSNSAETLPSISLDTETVGISHVIDERECTIQTLDIGEVKDISHGNASQFEGLMPEAQSIIPAMDVETEEATSAIVKADCMTTNNIVSTTKNTYQNAEFPTKDVAPGCSNKARVSTDFCPKHIQPKPMVNSHDNPGSDQPPEDKDQPLYDAPNCEATALWVYGTSERDSPIPGFIDMHHTTIELTETINWEANSECVLSATSWEYKETEKAIIASVSGNIVTLTQPLQFKHLSSSSSLTGRSFPFYQQAEVGLLTRSVRIIGKDYAEQELAFMNSGDHEDADGAPAAKESYVRNCGFNYKYNSVIGIFGSNNDGIEHNDIFRHTSSGILDSMESYDGCAQAGLTTRGSPCDKTYTWEDLYVTIKNTVIVVAGHSGLLIKHIGDTVDVLHGIIAIFGGTHIKTVEEIVEPSKLSALPDPLCPFMASIEHIIVGG